MRLNCINALLGTMTRSFEFHGHLPFTCVEMRSINSWYTLGRARGSLGHWPIMIGYLWAFDSGPKTKVIRSPELIEINSTDHNTQVIFSGINVRYTVCRCDCGWGTPSHVFMSDWLFRGLTHKNLLFRGLAHKNRTSKIFTKCHENNRPKNSMTYYSVHQELWIKPI